jgi:hypothetical protein
MTSHPSKANRRSRAASILEPATRVNDKDPARAAICAFMSTPSLISRRECPNSDSTQSRKGTYGRGHLA